MADILRDEGFEVSTAQDGFAAERLATRHRYDLILLDIMLPGQSGLKVCEKVRRQDRQTPILMLTARGSVEDRVRGLRLGADDYLQKPFDTRELLARIDAMLRRAPATRQPMQIGRALVDFEAGTVTVDSERVDLSAQTMRLLFYLVQHERKAVSREQLLHEVWGHKSRTSTRTVDVHVGWLRRAIENDPKRPRHIITVHAVGYRYDP